MFFAGRTSPQAEKDFRIMRRKRRKSIQHATVNNLEMLTTVSVYANAYRHDMKMDNITYIQRKEIYPGAVCCLVDNSRATIGKGTQLLGKMKA